MEYLFTAHKSKVELQAAYQLRKSKAKYAFTEGGETSSPNSRANLSRRGSFDSTNSSKEKQT